MEVLQLIDLAMSKGASDLHLVVSRPPLLRIDGLLEPLDDMPPLDEDDIVRAFKQITNKGKSKKSTSYNKEQVQFENHLELDFASTIPGVCRLRCNAAKQRGTYVLSIRLLPLVVPTVAALGLPDVCQKLPLEPRGLIMVSGPAGSGKSTTMAAMINLLNSKTARRVVTVEDPIEYVFPGRKCLITQRELGNDTLSFAQATKHVLRQDPDVILVGELRDYETAAAVLGLAETGHLVLTTTHGSNSVQSVERIIDLFPPYERSQAQSRLASLLVGVLSQALIPRSDGPGRVVAVEVMLANPAVKSLIREDKIYQLPNAIRSQGKAGMQLFDHALVKLYREGLITYENMLAFCQDEHEIEQSCKQAQVTGLPSLASAVSQA